MEFSCTMVPVIISFQKWNIHFWCVIKVTTTYKCLFFEWNCVSILQHFIIHIRQFHARSIWYLLIGFPYVCHFYSVSWILAEYHDNRSIHLRDWNKFLIQRQFDFFHLFCLDIAINIPVTSFCIVSYNLLQWPQYVIIIVSTMTIHIQGIPCQLDQGVVWFFSYFF